MSLAMGVFGFVLDPQEVTVHKGVFGTFLRITSGFVIVKTKTNFIQFFYDFFIPLYLPTNTKAFSLL